MPASPLVSIIIPAYNQAQYLRLSIESALAQTYPYREIIVVDDGSTDETAAIAKNYGDKIRYIYQENRGLAGARNTGIRTAKGELIGLLDSDDIWLPEYLQSIVSLANEHPQAVVFYSAAQCMDTAGRKLPQIVGRAGKMQDNLLGTLLKSNFLIPSTITIRRQTLVDLNCFDPNLRSCEDWDLWLRILSKTGQSEAADKKFIGTEDVLVYYRIHEQSLSANVAGMHAAKQAVIEKRFGDDDGAYDRWTPEKRAAYSGLYRYFLITSIQRGGNWQAGVENLYKSLQIDPARAGDMDLFYELALGVQPVGYRGSAEKIDIDANAQQVIDLIQKVFQRDESAQIRSLKSQVYGTAYYAIGLAAYNTGKLKPSRRYLLLAGKYRPSLWFSSKLPGNLIKSMLGSSVLTRLRRLKNSISDEHQ